MLLDLQAGEYRLVIQPDQGGAVARFDWRDEPLFRPCRGSSIFDLGCFPLVPFSNRIAFGQFPDGDRIISLKPNFPGRDHPHALHGFGWLAAWEVAEQSAQRVLLRHRYSAGDWPWDYIAEQCFNLSEDGLVHRLSLLNQSQRPMPAGLGFHPYFPHSADTQYLGLHCAEWQTSSDGLPLLLAKSSRPVDWWHGAPIGTRVVDTVYEGRDGELGILWPDRDIALSIKPSANLPCTVVYTPEGEDYFCVEPVSHATDAVNRSGAMPYLDPGQTMHATVIYRARITI
jgi:aldose 1-epimerase